MSKLVTDYVLDRLSQRGVNRIFGYHMTGAVAGYASVALLAFRGVEGEAPSPRGFALWEALHIGSIGVAIGLASLVAHLLRWSVAWLLGGFLATAVYLAGTALQLRLGHRFAVARSRRRTEALLP